MLDVGKVLARLRACLCREVARTSIPVCQCVYAYGASRPPMDICFCECEGGGGQGVGWVRLVTIDPVTGAFRRELGNREAVGPCGPSWQAVIELGVYRCVSVGEDGLPPDEAARTADAALLWADALALVTTVSCCLDGWDPHGPADEVIVNAVGRWTPVGPSGGGAGATITITVALD